jgi:hypothetical protein
VLALNTLNWNKKNDESSQGTDAQDEMDWLEAQLSSSAQRKFVISNHIYPGAKWDGSSKDLLH